jgi:fido (protein-threonine AMPylation protein)
MRKELEAYIDTLENKADAYNIHLKAAFDWKDISTSTYYRAVNRQVDLKYATARQVNDALEELKALFDHRASLKK